MIKPLESLEINPVSKLISLRKFKCEDCDELIEEGDDYFRIQNFAEDGKRYFEFICSVCGDKHI